MRGERKSKGDGKQEEWQTLCNQHNYQIISGNLCSKQSMLVRETTSSPMVDQEPPHDSTNCPEYSVRLRNTWKIRFNHISNTVLKIWARSTVIDQAPSAELLSYKAPMLTQDLLRYVEHKSICELPQCSPSFPVYNCLGLGWSGGLVRGSRKYKFADRGAPSGKYSTCER